MNLKIKIPIKQNNIEYTFVNKFQNIIIRILRFYKLMKLQLNKCHEIKYGKKRNLLQIILNNNKIIRIIL